MAAVLHALLLSGAALVLGQSATNDTATPAANPSYTKMSPDAVSPAAGPVVSGLASLLGSSAVTSGPEVGAVALAEVAGRRGLKHALALGPEPVQEAMPPAPRPVDPPVMTPGPTAPPMSLIDIVAPSKPPATSQENPPAHQVLPAAPQGAPEPEMIVPPTLSLALPPGQPMEKLPKEVIILKEIIAKQEETIKQLNSQVADLTNKLLKTKPAEYIPPPPSLQPISCCDCNISSMLQRVCEEEKAIWIKSYEELQALCLKKTEDDCKEIKKQESKPVKKKFEFVVQKKKTPFKKGKPGKIKYSTINPNAGCPSLLENEKSITQALQAGINERDIQLTSLQEMLKNAEDRVTIVQNAEINACNVKLQNSASEMNSCREDIKTLKRLTGNCGERFSGSPIDERSGGGDSDEDDGDSRRSSKKYKNKSFPSDDDDDDDDNDEEIMSLVQKIVADGGKNRKVAVITLNKAHFKKRVENKIQIVTLGDKEYYFHNTSRVNWHQAKKFCEKNKMRLLSIEHDEENSMVSSVIMNTGGVYWTSGRDDAGSGDFQWTAINRSFNNFLNWAPGQPEVGNPKKRCVQVGPSGDMASWTVADCNTQMHHICERTVAEG